MSVKTSLEVKEYEAKQIMDANTGKTEHLFRMTGTLILFETEQNK